MFQVRRETFWCAPIPTIIIRSNSVLCQFKLYNAAKSHEFTRKRDEGMQSNGEPVCQLVTITICVAKF